MNVNLFSAATVRAVSIGLLAILTLQQLESSAAMADPVADFEAMRQSQQRNLEQLIAGLPPLGGHEDHKLDEIFQISMEGVNLQVRTPLDSTLVPTYARTRVAGFGQPVMVRVVGGADHGKHAQGEAVVPEELIFQYTDYSKARLISSLSLTQTGSVVFSLSLSQTSPSGSRSVQFLVQKVPSLPGGGRVTLNVTEAGFLPHEPHARLTLGASDCEGFLRRHPQAVAKYLMPLLDRLGQEGVFAPEPVLVMQVFPDSFSVDAVMRHRVELLLPELDADSYHQRDQAMSELEDMGKDAVKAIVYLDRSILSPEQNARVDRALIPFGLIPRAEADRLRHDREFLINCLYCDDLITRRSALVEIKSLTGRDVELPDDLGRAARAAAISQLRAKLDGPELRDRADTNPS